MKLGKRASQGVKLSLIHSAFEKGKSLLPNFKSNAYMNNLKNIIAKNKAKLKSQDRFSQTFDASDNLNLSDLQISSVSNYKRTF